MQRPPRPYLRLAVLLFGNCNGGVRGLLNDLGSRRRSRLQAIGLQFFGQFFWLRRPPAGEFLRTGRNMAIPAPMRSARFSMLLVLSLTAAGCSIFHRRAKPAPVVETVRTADSPAPPTAARDLADVMGTELKLTPDQTARVRTVLNGTLTQSNDAKEKFAPKSPQLMAELKRININSQKELSAVVGPAKFKQLQTKTMQQKIAADMQQRQK